jgi:hypothetical protein
MHFNKLFIERNTRERGIQEREGEKRERDKRERERAEKESWWGMRGFCLCPALV